MKKLLLALLLISRFAAAEILPQPIPVAKPHMMFCIHSLRTLVDFVHKEAIRYDSLVGANKKMWAVRFNIPQIIPPVSTVLGRSYPARSTNEFKIAVNQGRDGWLKAVIRLNFKEGPPYKINELTDAHVTELDAGKYLRRTRPPLLGEGLPRFIKILDNALMKTYLFLIGKP